MNDLTGKKFNRLLGIKKVGVIGTRTMWEFSCDCGKIIVARGTHVTGGRTKSCGCYMRETAKLLNTTHGLSKSRGYQIWRDMINRCHYDKYAERHLYGGRGIVVCERWRNSFEAFIYDMGYPLPLFSIDRIDSNGNYELSNCRWATAKERANNKRQGNRL